MWFYCHLTLTLLSPGQAERCPHPGKRGVPFGDFFRGGESRPCGFRKLTACFLIKNGRVTGEKRRGYDVETAGLRGGNGRVMGGGLIGGRRVTDGWQ